MRYPSLIVAAALAVALPLLAPAPLRAQTAVPAQQPADHPAISVSAVQRLPLRDRVIASGLVGPVERVVVQPEVEGQAIELLAAEVGDSVAAGQVLARLSVAALTLQKGQLLASRASAAASIAQAEAQLVEAEAAAAEARRVSLRSAALSDQGVTSSAAADQAAANAEATAARVSVARQGLEVARAQAAVVEAQVANIELQLARTEVRAPVAGLVLERNATRGAIASGAGAPMFVLARDGALELQADVAEQEVMRLAPGQPASMTAVGTRAALPGHVRLVEPGIDSATRLGRVRVAVDQPEQVRSGMFLQAEILVSERMALAVPVTAVGASAEGATVMRVHDGIVTRTPVVTGVRDGGMVEILSGLFESDLVVTKAAAFVRDGDRITPVPAASAAAVN
ncbi:efflux transporter periplasmic adaptor subunit [Rhodobacter veldkampii DSM 11550]|uniref:Efflux RND transporter periplasmic adaptor subunit n=1 Tax=Phaeovulum veldkampii DSM 11550 TaxID=1185920 RepID=A0A2T4JN39_9RHOB|nr:efflux RND transporter periplasmic adaptor subunit [Phaeovulum veldkampii]MBK5947666.1 efflux transporter periplasmic adaptor subunit [Phaeovulum veldkampii DSM 11550]PTE19332.1 efflux RND transporter periplasmic adaptor subunit [Phaeovulum veldkampii DSM 11550]TDQ62172.1 HlyD family secretion protein [Phaeovulum veldkampii DSM 11550]